MWRLHATTTGKKNVKRRAGRIPKTRDELGSDLRDVIDILIDACARYDVGNSAHARTIAVNLAVLLKGAPGKAPSLLQQLGLRDGQWFDSAAPEFPRSRFPQCRLAALLVQPDIPSAIYVPLCATPHEYTARRAFPLWWSQDPVVRDLRGRTFTRLDLVLHMRDSEAAHADEALEEAYADLRLGRYMGWQAQIGCERRAIPHPHFASLRQIAHETITEVSNRVAAGSLSPYPRPSPAPLGLIIMNANGSEIRPEGFTPQFTIDDRITIVAEM